MPKYKIKAWAKAGQGGGDEFEEVATFMSQEEAGEYAEEQCQTLIGNVCDAGSEATLIDETVRFYLCKSSSMVAFGYDADAKTLGVIYKGKKGDHAKDRLYVYKKVEPAAFSMLLDAPSFGKAIIELRKELEYENLSHPGKCGVVFEWCVICPHCSEPKLMSDEGKTPYSVTCMVCPNCGVDDPTVYPWYTGGCELI